MAVSETMPHQRFFHPSTFYRTSIFPTPLRKKTLTTAVSRTTTKSFPASFLRGGTSNGLIIHRDDLPKHEAEWQPILSSAMGSPDPFGRQLNGMGYGNPLTSKICVISKPDREDADVDYTFIQVGIKAGHLDIAGNCGNMSSAVSPVAWNDGIVSKASINDAGDDGKVTLRMFNTNTNKIVHSTFKVDRKTRTYEPCGDYSIDGVSGTGSRTTQLFLDPSGSKTGKALPTGKAVDSIELSDGSVIQASLSDVANPGVFVLASDVGLAGDVTPDALEANSRAMARLEDIRQAGARLMGLDPDIQSIPKIALVSKPMESASAVEGINIVCRAISMQQAHNAVQVTLALNLGAACRIPGTIPALTAVGLEGKQSVTVGHASGKIEVGSVWKDGRIESALLHRTARVLMKGDVFYTVDNDG